MRQRDLIISTNFPEVSSGTASLINSVTQCGLEPPEGYANVWSTEGEVSIAWVGGNQGEEYDHLIFFGGDATRVTATASPSLPWRLISHMLVDRMPDDGVPEMVETLASMHQFYHTRLLQCSAPKIPHRIAAHVLEPECRPEFEYEATAD